MTIHSMPNNKKFEANYDRIFNKKPKGSYSPDRYFCVLDRQWEEVFVPGWPFYTHDDLYVVKQDPLIGYTLQMPMGVSYFEMKDFQEAMECCSRYQP